MMLVHNNSIDGLARFHAKEGSEILLFTSTWILSKPIKCLLPLTLPPIHQHWRPSHPLHV